MFDFSVFQHTEEQYNARFMIHTELEEIKAKIKK